MELRPIQPAADAPEDTAEDLDIIEPLCAVFRRHLKAENQKYTPERARVLDAVDRFGDQIVLGDSAARPGRSRDTVLEPGMVISMEPMLTVPEGTPGAGGYREHDILVITEDGNENITGYPYGPAFNVVG